MDVFGEFHGRLDEAHKEFLATGGQKPLPFAVQAARFNHFITTRHPDLALQVTPDLCESYLRNARKKEMQTGAATQDALSRQIHALEVALAFARFKKETNFKGSESAEIIAFQSFAARRYPELGEVSEDDGKAAIDLDRRARLQRMTVFGLAALLLSTVFLIGSCRRHSKHMTISNNGLNGVPSKTVEQKETPLPIVDSWTGKLGQRAGSKTERAR